MSYLAIAFKSIKMPKLLKTAKTIDWPQGEARMVKKALQEKYRPDDQLLSPKHIIYFTALVHIQINIGLFNLWPLECSF